MNPQEEKAYADLMIYHKKKNKFTLQLYLAKLWFLHCLAAKIPLPSIVVKIHRIRGVKIGKDVYIGDNVHLDLFHPELITIKDNVSIGMRTMIFTHRSHWSPFLEKIYPRLTAEVTIEKGSWIAPGCIILPGVTIGENSVIGSGSIVLKNVEPYTIAAGNPAKVIKRIDRS
jgi:acetyltransferase-like isoleucine patch superfamily enzyme